MALNESDILIIDQFLRGELSNSEKDDFKQRLLSDRAFEEEYLQKRALQINLRQSALHEKRMMLKRIEQEMYSNNEAKSNNTLVKKAGKRRMLFALSTAAAILLVLSLFFPWWNPGNPYNDLFEQQFESYPSSVIKRSTKRNLSDIKAKAYALYGIGDYKKSAPLLEQLGSEGDIDSYLYAGIAYTGLHKYKKSNILLDKYKSNTDAPNDVSNFYMAINLLMLGNKEVAVSTFQNLSARKGFIGEKAKAFLEGIEQ